MLTFDQALTELSKLTASGPATTQQLMDLAAKVSLDTAPGYTQGSVTLLYSGEINGVNSTDYIGKMIKQQADIRVMAGNGDGAKFNRKMNKRSGKKECHAERA